MKTGKLFGIGVGPGDPGLLTVKAIDGNGIAGSCHHRGWHLCESQ